MLNYIFVLANKSIQKGSYCFTASSGHVKEFNDALARIISIRILIFEFSTKNCESDQDVMLQYIQEELDQNFDEQVDTEEPDIFEAISQTTSKNKPKLTETIKGKKPVKSKKNIEEIANENKVIKKEIESIKIWEKKRRFFGKT